MGGFHKGHLSLIKKAKKKKGKTLVSIFVNPKQFNNRKDYINYPRNNKKDLNILKRLKVDYVYLPNNKEIYSFKPKKKVYLDTFSKKLCGKNRKGHFKGVLNIVNRLIEVVKPKFLFLGLKDFQQLYLIHKHIKKKKISSKIITCKTVREKNGVACSTRNYNINKKNFLIASKVYWYLVKKKRLIRKKLSNFNTNQITKDLMNIGITKVDYVELYNLNTVKKPKKRKENFRIFIAYYLNDVRLIDNI